jgi:hypothetical protein
MTLKTQEEQMSKEEIKTQSLTIGGIHSMSNNPPCTYKEYKLILDTFHKLVSKNIIELGTRYTLPHKLGVLSIRRKKNKPKKVIDFHKTKLYGETIYHNNYHSEGQYCFYHWEKEFPYAIFTYKQLYEFEPTRFNKRTLAKGIKEKNTLNKYVEI